MTKRERKYIEEKIEQFIRWEEEIRKETKTATDAKEVKTLYEQLDRCTVSANTLYNLLNELDRLNGK